MTTLRYTGPVTVAFSDHEVAPQQTFNVDDDDLAEAYLRRDDIVEVDSTTSSLAEPVTSAATEQPEPVSEPVEQPVAAVPENPEPTKPTKPAQEG